jgi:hypothetical protein
MRTLQIVTIMIMLFSCQSKKMQMDGVENILITINPRETDENVITLTDKKDIELIVSIIENANREPFKFIADYKLELKLKDEVKIVLVKNNHLNIEGLTYELNSNLGNEIKRIIEATK